MYNYRICAEHVLYKGDRLKNQLVHIQDGKVAGMTDYNGESVEYAVHYLTNALIDNHIHGGDGLIAPLYRHVQEQVHGFNPQHDTRIAVSRLGDKAGILGAAFISNLYARYMPLVFETDKKILVLRNEDFLARLKEFESPTFRLGGGRSILLSYKRIYIVLGELLRSLLYHSNFLCQFIVFC